MVQILRTVLPFLPRIILTTAGIILSAVSVQLFMVPYNIAPTGVTGISVIINEFIDIPLGLTFILLNIPILLLGYRYLGGMTVVILTIYATVGYSLALELVTPFLPADGVSDNVLLNALFAGVTGGISLALVLRAGSTYGGTSVIALIIQRKTGIPLSNTYLYTDMGIVAAAAFVFGMEPALYAAVTLFISGLATDYVLEGPSIIRVVFIITERPQEVSQAILQQLQRGVTSFDGTGMYTGQARAMLYVTISRSEVTALRDLVAEIDERAFVVIGQGHTAYGAGFRKPKKNGAPHPKVPATVTSQQNNAA